MSFKTRYSKVAVKYAYAVGLLICFAQYAWAQDPIPLDLNIVAHQDDDILFMNPDILNAVVAGRRQVTVYITAGNVNPGDHDYAVQREEGAIAGYSKLLLLADAKIKDPNHFTDFSEIFQFDSRYPGGCDSHCFACEEHACELSTPGEARGQIGKMLIGGRNLNVVTIGDGPDAPRVTLIFLRVHSSGTPNANIVDPNFVLQTWVNLAQLYTSANPKLQIQSPFVQTGYTKQDLISELVEIIKFFQPDQVRTQDTADIFPVDSPDAFQIPDLGCGAVYPYTGRMNFYDHTDHVWGARFARQALKKYNKLLNVKKPTYSNYKGYNLEWTTDASTRVSTQDFCLKKSIAYRYALHDYYLIGNGFCDADPNFNPRGTDLFCRDAYATPFDCFFYTYIGYQLAVPTTLP
jgi:hypothetical protein